MINIEVNANALQKSSGAKDEPFAKQNYFGETLRELRSMKQFTQGEAARKVGLTQAQWSSYELGKTRPDLDMVKHIAKQFGIKPIAIVGYSFDKSEFENDPDSVLPLEYYAELADVTIEKARTEEMVKKMEKKMEEYKSLTEELKKKMEEYEQKKQALRHEETFK